MSECDLDLMDVADDGSDFDGKNQETVPRRPIDLYTYQSILPSQPNGLSTYDATIEPNKHNLILFLARKQSNCATPSACRHDVLSYAFRARRQMFPSPRRRDGTTKPNNSGPAGNPGVKPHHSRLTLGFGRVP